MCLYKRDEFNGKLVHFVGADHRVGTPRRRPRADCCRDGEQFEGIDGTGRGCDFVEVIEARLPIC